MSKGWAPEGGLKHSCTVASRICIVVHYVFYLFIYFVFSLVYFDIKDFVLVSVFVQVRLKMILRKWISTYTEDLMSLNS